MLYSTQAPRTDLMGQVRSSLREAPVTALLGPRQCGKTWLARHFQSTPNHYFDLQDYIDQVRLADRQFRVLDDLDGTVVIDEAQLKPELFPKLRVLADRPHADTRFLITGSASPGIVRGVSESLAGRVRLIQLGGFNCDEIGWENARRLWLRGGLPPAYLRERDDDSFKWRLDYISTFLGRDLPSLVDLRLGDEELRRFFLMLAHHHGQHWNHSEIARQIGVSYKSVQRYVDLFKGAFLLRELPPYSTNLAKRIRKAPKLYIRDTGLLHALLMLRDEVALQAHPRYGASWEGFGIEHVVRLARAHDEDCFTWSIQSGPEVDLVLRRPAGLFGFEFKAGDAPKRTPSMTTAIQDLQLKRLFVVYPGDRDYLLGDDIQVVGFANLAQYTVPLR